MQYKKKNHLMNVLKWINHQRDRSVDVFLEFFALPFFRITTILAVISEISSGEREREEGSLKVFFGHPL